MSRARGQSPCHTGCAALADQRCGSVSV